MGTYDRQVALAERLIRTKGKAANLVRLAATLPDGSKPWKPGNSGETLDACYAVLLNLNQQDQETQSRIKGMEIQAGDRKVLLAASHLTAPPTTADLFRDNQNPNPTGDWSIAYVKKINPNGEQIMYILRVRQ